MVMPEKITLGTQTSMVGIVVGRVVGYNVGRVEGLVVG